LDLVVDRDKCQGHARCFSTAPDLFPLDDNGYIAVMHVHVEPSDEGTALHAVAGCPERAIRVAND